MVLGNCLQGAPLEQGILHQMTSRGPFQIQAFYDSMTNKKENYILNLLLKILAWWSKLEIISLQSTNYVGEKDQNQAVACCSITLDW